MWRVSPIVQQVLNESLRLFPTAPIIVRDINEDTELDGVRVPAGTIGIIPIYAIHRHRSLLDDPDRFDPARFAPSRPNTSRFQFLPFGAGPRICIGASFATIEATIMLATFVRAAHFDLGDGVDAEPGRTHVPGAARRHADARQAAPLVPVLTNG